MCGPAPPAFAAHRNEPVPDRFHLPRPGERSLLSFAISTSARASPIDRAELRFMPRYFFNTRIGDDLIPDPEGAELRDPDHAWEVARTMIQEILRGQGGPPNLLAASLEVTDEHGDVVLAFPFSEALMATTDDPPTRH
jgi:hypothetical protein